jgi:hypothetical protein
MSSNGYDLRRAYFHAMARFKRGRVAAFAFAVLVLFLCAITTTAEEGALGGARGLLGGKKPNKKPHRKPPAKKNNNRPPTPPGEARTRDKAYLNWKKEYGRGYSDEEDRMRYALYLETDSRISKTQGRSNHARFG